MKCIEDEIPFEIPSGWEWCRLQDLFIVCSAKRVLQADWKEEGIPFYRAREIVKLSDNGFVDNELFISEEHYLNLKKNYGVPNTGDIMLSAVGTIGKPYIVQENDTFYYKDASVICLQKIGYDISSEYIRLVLEAPYMQKMMYANSNGTTVDTITISTANQYYIAIPPLSEQLRIVDLAKTLLGHNLEIEEQKEKLIELIAVTKNKVLDLAIRGKLVPQNPDDEPASVLLERIRNEKESLVKQGKLKRDKKESIIYKGDDNSYYMTGKKEPLENVFDLPNGWIWASLPEVVFFQEGPGIMKKDFRDSGVPLIRISGLQTDKVSLEGCNFLDPEMVESKWKHFKLEMGDIVICTSASIGKVSIVDSETVGAIPYTGQIRFQMSPAITKDYFLYFAMSDIYLNQVNLLKTGNCIQHYGPTHLKQVIVPLPPIDEQIRISSAIKQYLMHLELISEQIY